MMLILIKLNAFITILYGYESDYQHNYSLKTLTLIVTIRMPVKRSLNNVNSLSHIRKIFPGLIQKLLVWVL